MVLGIKYNKMYEDLAHHIKEELIKVFKADDWGEYTPSNWRLKTSDLFPRKSYSYTPGALVDADGLECFDEFKFIWRRRKDLLSLRRLSSINQNHLN